jgi:hypothetical protein
MSGRWAIRALAAALALAALPAIAAPAAPTQLQLVAANARLAIARSPSHWLQSLDAPPPTLVAALAPTGDDAFDADWAVIAAGAIETDRESGDIAVTLWFNPVFDAGLAVRWARTARGWTPIAGAPVPGELLRGEALARGAAGGRPAWPAAAGSLAQNLAAAAVEDDRAALSGAWPAALDASAAQRLAWTRGTLARVGEAQRTMRLMATDPGYGDAAWRVRRALVEDDPAKLPPSVQRDLARMGEAGLLDLQPVAALRRPDGWSLVLQSPAAVGAAWFAHFADPAPGREADLAGFTVAPLTPPPAPASGTSP